MNPTRPRVKLTAALLAIVFLPGAVGAATFTSLNCIDCFPTDLSADGGVVVGEAGTATGQQPFRWTAADGVVLLTEPGSSANGHASGVSSDGSVVVGARFKVPGGSAFRWTTNEGFVSLGALPDNGTGNTEQTNAARDVTPDGSVIVGGADFIGLGQTGIQAFRWTAAGGAVGLGDLAGGNTFSEAWGVSADGGVVAGYGWSTSGREAFRWTQTAGMVGLGDFPGGSFESWAWAVSGDGATIVGFGNTASGQQAFRWQAESGMSPLSGVPESVLESYATDVSADGSVVVGAARYDLGGPHDWRAFIWTADTGLQDLHDLLVHQGANLDGWTLEAAQAISVDGRTVVGYGLGPDGIAWRATLSEVPLPATAVLFATAFAALRWRPRVSIRRSGTLPSRSSAGAASS